MLHYHVEIDILHYVMLGGCMGVALSGCHIANLIRQLPTKTNDPERTGKGCEMLYLTEGTADGKLNCRA